jgi:hypothetical protein
LVRNHQASASDLRLQGEIGPELLRVELDIQLVSPWAPVPCTCNGSSHTEQWWREHR